MLPNRPHQSALRKGRASQPGHAYHVTFTTHKRVALGFAQRAVIARYLISDDFSRHAEPVAWVVMPDHLHVLFQLQSYFSLSEVVQRLKSRSAFLVNRLSANNRGQIWQPGFYDHALRNDESLRHVARYIVRNPVRAGLVKRVGDYPFWDAIWI